VSSLERFSVDVNTERSSLSEKQNSCQVSGVAKQKPCKAPQEQALPVTQLETVLTPLETRQEVRFPNCFTDHHAAPAVLYEAKAMSAQFEHYLPDAAILFPFGGDPSIPAKWKLAQLLATRWKQYHVPVQVVYFGDLDEKGVKIEKTAKADILGWTTKLAPDGEFQWARGGLDEDHVERYELPHNLEGKGYQWEALSDVQAREIIEDAIDGLIDFAEIDEIEKQEELITAGFRRCFREAFDLN